MKNLSLANQKILEERKIAINKITLFYKLYRSERKSSGRYVYSVEISVVDGDNTESNFVEDITRMKSRAKDIFNLLYENTVTPCTLTDILEDIL